jgi:hypothetical protein
VTKNEAHDLLDRRKQGLAVPQYLVNRALVVSGDISMACSPCQATWVESTGMAQGEGIRELFHPFVDRDNPGLNSTNEGAQ